MFEDEYRQIQMNPVKVEYLLKDSCMLFPPTTTPMSGVEFIKRLPSGDIERARRVNLFRKKIPSKSFNFSQSEFSFLFDLYYLD